MAIPGLVMANGQRNVPKPVVSPSFISPLKPSLPTLSVTITIKEDERLYSPYNVFWPIIQNTQKNLQTPLLANSTYSLAFDTLHKRTKEHMLVIPKGPYISFPHFMSYASPEEVVDLVRTIALVAENKGLDKTGYRIIANHGLYPGVAKNNNASQEVAHFHVHVAGGECLGKPVAGIPYPDKFKQKKSLTQVKKAIEALDKLLTKKNQAKAMTIKVESSPVGISKVSPTKVEVLKANPLVPEAPKGGGQKGEQEKLLKAFTTLKQAYGKLESFMVYADHSAASMAISNPAFLPMGQAKGSSEVLTVASQNVVAQMTFQDQGVQKSIVAYRVPQYNKPIPQLIGFMIWNEKKEPLYQSFHDFAKQATTTEIYTLFRFVEQIAIAVGIHETGYRLVSNHGLDAWHKPNIFQVFIAGGRPLGVTVTNVYGNRKKTLKGKISTWEKSRIYYYKDILDSPHLHCPITEFKKEQLVAFSNSAAILTTKPKVK